MTRELPASLPIKLPILDQHWSPSCYLAIFSCFSNFINEFSLGPSNSEPLEISLAEPGYSACLLSHKLWRLVKQSGPTFEGPPTMCQLQVEEFASSHKLLVQLSKSCTRRPQLSLSQYLGFRFVVSEREFSWCRCFRWAILNANLIIVQAPTSGCWSCQFSQFLTQELVWRWIDAHFEIS